MNRIIEQLLLLVFIMYINGTVWAQFSGGNGSMQSPYQITTSQQLNLVRNYLNDTSKYFTLMNDLDITDECSPGGIFSNSGKGWIPIGDSSNFFKGRFNGNGKKILGLYINRITSYQGLFGRAESARIINLGLEEVNVTGGSDCGGLVGYLSSLSLIDYCYVHGTVQGQAFTGGLIGQCRSAVKNSQTMGSVNGTTCAGGLVGWFWGNNAMSGCHSHATVYGSVYVGGLVGNSSGTIHRCYTTGNITASSDAGGLIGSASLTTTIQTCYCLGNVSVSTSTGGGFIGRIAGNSMIINCYSRGNLTRTSGTNATMGGFCGINDNSQILYCYSTGSVKTSAGVNIDGKGFAGSFVTGATMVMNDNYFDMNTSGQNTGTGAVGKTTDAMTYEYEAGTYTGWDFPETWREDYSYLRNNGYPFLFWQQPNGLQVPLVTTTAPTVISATTATGGGNVTFDGNTTVTARGVCWSTTPGPTIQNTHTNEGPGVEEFVSTIPDLTPSMTYYIRAYATNTSGTGYGDELTFTTLPPTDLSVNLIRGGPTSTLPEAIPVQITGENASPYTTNLAAWTGNYQAPQSFYDQGTYKNDPDNWSNISGSSSTGSRWSNPSPGTSCGILVVDLKQIRAIQDISVFQMFAIGKTTHIALATHPDTSGTAPVAANASWVVILPKSSIGAGINNTSFISSPTNFTVNATTRYLKIMVYNDGTQGSQSAISLKGIKIFSGPYPPKATLNNITLNSLTDEKCFGATMNITTRDFLIESGGSARLAAGLNVFVQIGTKVDHGGYLHALIKTDGNYCQPAAMTSSAVNQNVESPESISSNLNSNEKILILPNPNQGKFSVLARGFSKITPTTIQIFTLLGEKIAERLIPAESSTQIDITQHPAGVYVLILRSESFCSTVKVIKR